MTTTIICIIFYIIKLTFIDAGYDIFINFLYIYI